MIYIIGKILVTLLVIYLAFGFFAIYMVYLCEVPKQMLEDSLKKGDSKLGCIASLLGVPALLVTIAYFLSNANSLELGEPYKYVIAYIIISMPLHYAIIRVLFLDKK